MKMRSLRAALLIFVRYKLRSLLFHRQREVVGKLLHLRPLAFRLNWDDDVQPFASGRLKETFEIPMT